MGTSTPLGRGEEAMAVGRLGKEVMSFGLLPTIPEEAPSSSARTNIVEMMYLDSFLVRIFMLLFFSSWSINNKNPDL